MLAVIRPTLVAFPVAGWKEHVSLPKLEIGPIVAKLDTGARSATLHADEIYVRGRRVVFVIMQLGRKRTFQAPLVGLKRVKSSNGISETRAVIRTDVQVGGQTFKAEVSLTNRSYMGVPMLLGRNSLKGRFVVNPGKTFLLEHTAKRTKPK